MQRQFNYRKGELDLGRGVGKGKSISIPSLVSLYKSESESESRCAIKGESFGWGVVSEERMIIEVGDDPGWCRVVTGCEVDATLVGDGERSTIWGINGAWLPSPFDSLKFFGAGEGDDGLLRYQTLHFTLWWPEGTWSTDLSKSLPLGGWWKVTLSIPSYYWYLSESKEIQKIWEHIPVLLPKQWQPCCWLACVGNPLQGGGSNVGCICCTKALHTMLWISHGTSVRLGWALSSSASSLGSWLLSEQHPNKNF